MTSLTRGAVDVDIQQLFVSGTVHCVGLQGLGGAGITLPTSQLPKDTLNALVANWLDAFYEKAGEHSPWRRD